MQRCEMQSNLFRNWTVKRGNSKPVSWNSLMNRGKNLKLAGVLRNEPKACTSGAMIYHHPYQLLLSSSCQLGQPNGWLKCMCGHPRVKWKLWLWQKMDSCGRVYGLIQRNVIDMLLCFIISPPAPKHITIALPYTAIWQMSCTATMCRDMTVPSLSTPCIFCPDVWEHVFFKRPLFHSFLKIILVFFFCSRDPTTTKSCLLESQSAESNA